MPGGSELIIIAIVALVLLGGSQIPKFARNLGQAQKEFKKGIEEGSDEGTTSSEPQTKTPDTK